MLLRTGFLAAFLIAGVGASTLHAQTSVLDSYLTAEVVADSTADGIPTTGPFRHSPGFSGARTLTANLDSGSRCKAFVATGTGSLVMSLPDGCLGWVEASYDLQPSEWKAFFGYPASAMTFTVNVDKVMPDRARVTVWVNDQKVSINVGSTRTTVVTFNLSELLPAVQSLSGNIRIRVEAIQPGAKVTVTPLGSH